MLSAVRGMLAVLLVGSIAVGGCGPRYYAQPTTRAPHARVAIRFAHGARTDRGPIDDFIWIDGDPLELAVDDDHVLRVRVVPGRTQWIFKTMRYHEEESLMTVQHPGYGATGSSTSHGYTTTMPITEHVGEAGCTARLDLPMHDGEGYLLVYTYVSPEECNVSCRRTARRADGTVHAVPCEDAVDDEAPPRD